LMLHHRKELELSPEQIQALEQLRDDYRREAIRYDADLRIAEIDLESILKADPVDLEKVKVKLQDIERLRADLRLAQVRAIERGKALLSAEQREKLQTLLPASEQPDLLTEATPE
jgi:Spy/CpxP family protein refolding chaperone